MNNKLFALIFILMATFTPIKAVDLGYTKDHPLIFGIDMDYAPMEYVDKDGIPQGYDIEFTQELMRRLNIPFTYSPNTWANISGDVLSRKVDLGMMVYSPYRKNITNYSRAVFRLYYQIVFREEQKNEHFDVRNLSGKSIAYMSSRPITDTLRRAGAVLNVINDLPKTFQELSDGKYDAIICFRYQAKYLIKEYNLKNLKTEDLTLTPREYCYVSHDKRLIDAINVELEKMEKDGTISQIYDIVSHFDGFVIPHWVWYSLAILIMAFLVGFIIMQQRMQKRLRFEMERAQQSDHMKTVFLSNISHALRTPLNAIIGFSDVLMSTNESDLPCENRQELYGLINTNGQQLLYFINELLQLSNIEGNELKFDRTEIEVGQQIREFRDEYAGRTAEGVEIKVVDPPQKLKALIDTNLMRLVTTHMLANAVRHTHQGSITISYYEVDGGLRIDIKDTGEGLPEALRDNIFGLLTEKNTYVQSEVPGLGLSICKAIVDRCHGKIGHESPAEGGALFWHWVPCKIIIEV